jgi:hypothetical protein
MHAVPALHSKYTYTLLRYTGHRAHSPHTHAHSTAHLIAPLHDKKLTNNYATPH